MTAITAARPTEGTMRSQESFELDHPEYLRHNRTPEYEAAQEQEERRRRRLAEIHAGPHTQIDAGRATDDLRHRLLERSRSQRWKRIGKMLFRDLMLAGTLALLVGIVLFELEQNRADDRAVRERRHSLAAQLAVEKDLEGVVLSGQDMTGIVLTGRNLTGAKLDRANLKGANLAGATLTNADLSGANLSRANLRGADLSGALFENADLSAADLLEANLSDAIFFRADLSGAQLFGANVSATFFFEADLADAKTSGVWWSGKRPPTWPMFYKRPENAGPSR